MTSFHVSFASQAHRAQVDYVMKLVKEEMAVLKKFDMCNCSVGQQSALLFVFCCSLLLPIADEYVSQLDILLAKKLASISDLRTRLLTFKDHLKREEELSATVRVRA